MAEWRIEVGDCREVLRSMPAQSVHTVVTSPPYFGLRDYGTEGQIGLEPTPDEFVAALVEVFREVRRVLRDDGTVWLNLGDSYAAGGGFAPDAPSNTREAQAERLIRHRPEKFEASGRARARGARSAPAGCKPKDLLGIPWMVAFALRQPWYAGSIKSEIDRVWLAAMIDAEGCVYIHRRREGQNNGQGYVRKTDSFGSGLEVANTSLRVVERCQEITGRGSISRQDKDRRQPLYRWCLRTNECRDVLREVYPYLVAKQHEARLACGVPSSGERATAAWEALKLLHGGGLTDVDFAAPASLHEPGWYLRMDNIWSKLNPMPESVTDRPTKAHEYVFLLSKGPRYFYDADAIREPAEYGRRDWSSVSGNLARVRGADPRDARNGEGSAAVSGGDPSAGRNRRSVWTVATQPYAGAHFATFPPKLIEPCILAGAPERACGECGAPWVRVTEKGELIDVGHTNKRPPTAMAADHAVFPDGPNGDRAARMERGGFTPNHAYERRTVGFEPSCPHNDGSASGVVLDPFAGAGTTGIVAFQHGREFVGIELNPEYAAMARERIETAVRLGFRSPQNGPTIAEGQESLFG